jgi:hypothetical protein
MVFANLIIHPGNDKDRLWHKLVSEFYAAVDEPRPLEAIATAFENYDNALGDKVRWEIVEQETSRTLIANNGRKHGSSMTFPFSLNDVDATDFIFGLSKWAYGENRNIIGHLLSINGKLKLWKPWDSRILTLTKKGDGDIYTWPVGYDIVAETNPIHDDPIAIFIKPFMQPDTFATFRDLTGNRMFGGEGQKIEHAGIWMMIKQLTATQLKKHPDYTIADLIRVTVGDLPRDVKVDSTDVKQ